jgi:hypothetical protein
VNSVTTTYKLTEQDFMNGCGQLWAHRAMGRTGNYVVAGLVVALGLMLLWQGVPGWWGWGLLIGAAVFIGLDISRDQIWRRYYRGAAKYQDEITATLSEDGVAVRSAEGANDLPWSHFKNYVMTRDYIVLLLDQRSFSLIPRTSFATHADHANAEVLFTANLKPLKARLL